MNAEELSILDYPEYFHRYISKLPQQGLLHLLEDQQVQMNVLLKKLTQEDLEHRYSEEKWTIAEVLQHLVDTERIFQYRALRIARKDKTPLAGFEQDSYVANSRANQRLLGGFIQEYNAVREASISLFKSFDQAMFQERGESSGGVLTAAAAGFIIAGHERHHLLLFKTNYNL